MRKLIAEAVAKALSANAAETSAAHDSNEAAKTTSTNATAHTIEPVPASNETGPTFRTAPKFKQAFPNRSLVVQSPALVKKEADQQGNTVYLYPPFESGPDPDSPPAPAVKMTTPQSDAHQLGIHKDSGKRARPGVLEQSEHDGAAGRVKRARLTASPAPSQLSRTIARDVKLEDDRELSVEPENNGHNTFESQGHFAPFNGADDEYAASMQDELLRLYPAV
jgi:hypothetical protein